MKSELKTSWNLSLVIKNSKEQQLQELREIVKKESYKFVNKWKERTDYLENPIILKAALDEYNQWETNWSSNATEIYYYQLLSSLDQNDPKIKAGLNKAKDLGLKILNDLQFFELKISKVNEETQKKFLGSTVLKPYRHYLEKLFRLAKYLLSEPEEKIMNLKTIPAHDSWVRMTQGFYSKEERKVLTEDKKFAVKNFSDMIGLMESQNKKVRDSAAKAFNDILSTHLEVAENEMNAVLMNKKINDELRVYERPDTARHIGDDLESDIVDTLVSTVSGKFSLAQRYYKLKAKILGVKKLKYHERNVEYGKIEKRYSFIEGVEILNKVFSELDSDFGNIFMDFVDSGRVDVYPKRGKRGGAFCSYNLITHPVYVLLNWTNKLDDVRTFAHEMGHGINDELVRKSQNALNFGTPTSTAEVASTFMEDFVIKELLKKADDELRLSLMLSKLNQDVSSIFRQIAFYNFEWELHKFFREKGYLSKEEIGKIFQRHMVSYMGPAVEQSPGSENWWSYIWHFRYFFYVYSYASGLLISKSLQSSVKKDSMFIMKVKDFLSAGLSNSPRNIFLKLDIDITDKKFWEKGLSEVENLLNETEGLAEKLGKI